MLRNFTGAVFLALTLAISLGMPARIAVFCSMTMTVCEGGWSGHPCCGDDCVPGESDCCFFASQDWEDFTAPGTLSLDGEIGIAGLPKHGEVALPEVTSTPAAPIDSIPDPPPLSGKERNTLFERHLI